MGATLDDSAPAVAYGYATYGQGRSIFLSMAPAVARRSFYPRRLFELSNQSKKRHFIRRTKEELVDFSGSPLFQRERAIR